MTQNNPSQTALELAEKILTECIFLSPDDTKTQASFTKAQAIIQAALDKAAADGAKRMQHKTQDEVLASLSLAEAGIRIRQLDAEQISKGE